MLLDFNESGYSARFRACIYKTDIVHQELPHRMQIEPQREIPPLQDLEPNRARQAVC